MIIVKQLPPEKFERLREIFFRDFDSELPDPQNSTIFAAFEDGKMCGFVLAEDIKILGQLYVVPEKRDSSSEIVKSLLSLIRKKYDGKEVVGAVASENRFRNLYRSLGMRPISGEFFRKNI